MRESITNIVWHTEAIAKHSQPGPLISLKEQTIANSGEGATLIFIYMKNADFLFRQQHCSI